MAAKRATIIYNPASGRPGRRAENARAMVRRLAERGISAETHATVEPEDAVRLSADAVAAGADIIISYGGDGTLNEVIQSLAHSPASLLVWAGGTANVVAADLGLPRSIERLADVAATGKTRRVALGLATRENGSADSERAAAVSAGDEGFREAAHAGDAPVLAPAPQAGFRRYFLMMAGIGLDASIARGVNRNLKRRTGEFAYWIAGLKHLFTWQAEPFVVEVDGQRYQSVFSLVGNGKRYGGGMMITPNARLEEPLFEVYVLPPQSSNLAYVRALAVCMLGHPEYSDATLLKGRHVKANSNHHPWVEADGEVIGPLPMTFDIVPDALSLIVP